jgi:hypothetical protein
MKPSSEATKLEGRDEHHEYLAAGKLKGNKALITGGESVAPIPELCHIYFLHKISSCGPN